MKNQVKWIAGLLVFALIIVGAYFLYNNLSDKYKNDQLETTVSSQNDDSSSEVKEKAPDFTVYDGSGNKVKLSELRGKPVVINFWATWCGFCVEEMPHFNEAYKENLNVQFMMVNMTDGYRETEKKARKFIEENGFEFPVYYDKDEDAARTYGASSLPVTFFIDKDGNLVTYRVGMMDKEMLDRGIDMIKNAQ